MDEQFACSREQAIKTLLDEWLACAHVQTNKTPLDTQLLLSRVQTADVLGISVRHVDTMIKDGTIPVRRLGRRVLVSPDALKAALAALPAA